MRQAGERWIYRDKKHLCDRLADESRLQAISYDSV